MFTTLSPIEEKLELKYGKQQGLNISQELMVRKS